MSIYKELSFTNDVETIKAVQFSVMGPDEIVNKSVCEIVSTDTYAGNEPIIGGLFDARMGVIENDKICKTCQQKNTFCPGHFGHIKLARPVFYIQFFDMVRKVLKCVCFRCSRLLIDPENPMIVRMMSKRFSRQKRFDHIYKCCSKIKRCGSDNPHGCGAKIPSRLAKENIGKIIMEWKEDHEMLKQVFTPEDVMIILKRITDEDAEILGFPKEINRPENLICSVFPVPPPSVRRCATTPANVARTI
jgi:DNA-directed RNA polymerase II subunit RPB1